jgi:GNAT superfamily N-acetyltransferase
MTLAAIKTDLSRILPLRTLFLQEANFQIRYDAVHERGWSDSYLLTIDGAEVGYGSTRRYDGPNTAARDTIFEFYVSPPFRRQASALFRALLAASAARYVECQSNDLQLAHLLFEFTRNINSDTLLFGAHTSTNLQYPGGIVRPKRDDDRIFEHTVEPVGPLVLEAEGEIIATGGAFTHYNDPFADIFMEVAPAHRRKGAGSYLVQEAIKACYLEGRVPAARTGFDNPGSRATLTRAGLAVVGCILLGEVKTS